MIADHALGLSLMKRDDESLHDYAMSFSPLAPFFGVPYRFAALFQMPSAVTEPEAAPAPKSVATSTPALAAPEAESAKPAKPAAAKKAKAKAKAADLVDAEIDAGAAAAKAMAAGAAPAIPDDMAEAAPDGEEALNTEPELVSAAEDVTETAAETGEAMADVVATVPALLYDSAPDLTDDLKRIKGVGPKLESELNGMGIYTFAQVASMTEANLAWIDANLTTFKGRSVREDWIGQASQLLAS